MAKRVAWNIYEEAILLDAWNQVENGEFTLKEAIENVSTSLRQMAINSGKKIENDFRSVSGITYQMRKLRYAATDGESGYGPAHHWCNNIVKMYQKDREKYEYILKEAKRRAEPKSHNNEKINSDEDEKFKAWLKINHPKYVDKIFSTFQTVDKYLQERHVIDRNLLQIKEINQIDLIIRKVRYSSGIQFTQKRNQQFFIVVLSAYRNYLNEQKEERQLELQSEEKVKDNQYELINGEIKSELQESPSTVEVQFKDHSDQCQSNASEDKNIKQEDQEAETDEIEKKDLILHDNKEDQHPTSAKEESNEIKEGDRQKSETQINHEEKPLEEKQTTPEKISFTEWLTNSQGIGTNTAHSYNRSLRDAETYAKDHHIGYSVIQDPMHPYQVRKTIEALVEDYRFADLNRREFNRFDDALNQYQRYLGMSPITVRKQIEGKKYNHSSKRAQNNSKRLSQNRHMKLSIDQQSIHDTDDKSYREILSKYFSTGFRISSKLDMMRFRNNWAEVNKSDNPKTDDEIRSIIRKITLQYNELVYLPEQMLDKQTAEKIVAYLEDTFNNGQKVVYYEALYDHFEQDLSSSHINTPDMLKNYLEHYHIGRYYFHNQYLSKYAYVKADPTDEIKQYMVEAGRPVTINELKKEFSNLTEKKITQVLYGDHSNAFIRNQRGEYFHADIVDLSDDELDKIKLLIQQAIDDKGYMSGKELVESVQTVLPEVAERNNDLSMVGFRDAIGYRLRKKFIFKGKIISEYGKTLSMSDVFARFGKAHDHFTLEQLNTLKDDLNTTIYFEDLYENALRVSGDEFVSKDQANFDIDQTDAVIERFCTGDYITLDEVNIFSTFPSAGFRWNKYLLEQYVAFYSKTFKLLHSNFNAGSAVGAIVRRSSEIKDFDELIVIELADSGVKLYKKNAFDHLINRGFLARRSYSKIDAALSKAKIRRSQKG